MTEVSEAYANKDDNTVNFLLENGDEYQIDLQILTDQIELLGLQGSWLKKVGE